MTSFFDNVAGTSTTTGTGTYAISGSVSGARPFSVIADGTEVSVRVSMGSDWEIVTGLIGGSGTSLTRASVSSSSNSDAAVNWGAGTKLIQLVATSSMLEPQELADLDAVDQLDGDELFPALQAGSAKKATADEVAGYPAVHVMSHGRDKLRFFSHLLGTPYTFSSSTTGAVFGGDEAELWASGTGASVAQGSALLFRFGIAICSTGTTSTGAAAITSTWAPVFLVEASAIFDMRYLVALQSAPTGAQDYTAHIGVFTAPSALPTQGIFFRASSANTNWIAVSKHTGGETTTDTGVAANNTWHTFRIYYDFNAGDVIFEIDGTQVASQSTNFPGVTPLHSGVAIRKTAGTTARQIWLDAFSMDILDASASGTHL